MLCRLLHCRKSCNCLNNAKQWGPRAYCLYILFTLNLKNQVTQLTTEMVDHDDVIKWQHFPRHWPFVRAIHRPPVNSPHKGQWRGALMFSLICARINGWVNNREVGDLRSNRVHYDDTVMDVSSIENWITESCFSAVRYDILISKKSHGPFEFGLPG